MWVKLDDGFWCHPKTVRVSLAGIGLHCTAMCWSAATLTDGHVPTEMLTVLRGKPSLARELVSVGLWDVAEDGWVIHDYLHYQPSSTAIREQRDKKASAGSLGNHNRWHVAKGVSDPDCPHCIATSSHDATEVASHNHRTRGNRPVPVPEPPVGKPSSSPPTSLDPTPDDDWIQDLAGELAVQRLGEVRAAGVTVTKTQAWLATVTANVLEELLALRDRLAVERPHLTEAQLRAALAGQWGTVQDLCPVCDMGWVVSGEVDDGLTRCRACAVPEGVVA